MIIYFFVIEPKFFNKAIPGDVFDNRMNRKDPEGCLNFRLNFNFMEKSISKS